MANHRVFEHTQSGNIIVADVECNLMLVHTPAANQSTVSVLAVGDREKVLKVFESEEELTELTFADDEVACLDAIEDHIKAVVEKINALGTPKA